MSDWRQIFSYKTDTRKKVRSLVTDTFGWDGGIQEIPIRPGSIGYVVKETERTYYVQWEGYPTASEVLGEGHEGWIISKSQAEIVND